LKPVIVTQTLVSVQGEGLSIGKPIILIRTNGCQLNCNFCDTSWTNEIINCEPFDDEYNTKTPFIINDNNIESYSNYIINNLCSQYNINTVLFTGGEPLLHSDFIGKFIDLNDTAFDLFEVETNGVLLYKKIEFVQKYKYDIQFNISPKISQYPRKYNKNFRSVLFLIASYDPQSFLKFVYSPAMEKDILNFTDNLDMVIPIVISPLTPAYGTEDFYKKYRESCLETIGFCLREGFRYTPREHVFLFGENREEFTSLK
jgi:organic radical activating enzyme